MSTLTPEEIERDRNFRFNYIINVLDGGFFGLAMGFASFTAVIPLFISTMTDSAILIGLAPAMHVMGWHFPQVFMAPHVARRKRYKPFVILMTIQERLPYLGLAAVAWFLPGLGPRWGLILTFFFLLWQGLGGGFTATAWQSMIGKIIPGNRWGFFYGSQAAAANLLSSLGVVLAGYVLEKTVFPGNYALCFLLTSAVMVVSWVFIALTREGEGAPIQQVTGAEKFHHVLFGILRKDGNFRAFIAGRILYQFGTMAFAFYTVYAVRTYGMSEVQVGVLTGVLTGSQMIANPLVGWLGDRWSHRGVLIIGAVTAALSVLAAWYAPSEGWFYLVFALAGIANVAFWTTGLAITLEFGTPAERPNYIGLSNTLIGPTAILVPILGGWLADLAGYRTTFLASTLGGLLALGVFSLLLRDPKRGIQN